ncbi:MAG TPA: DUF5989 family protein [Candidatus Omnitrophota bacterium]|nr:DUF5989 family protein [Candidatus Omnitrophota bacterium]HPT39396.1 DUF5989 family protein [Candidatus Omnitrophota bacterium]
MGKIIYMFKETIYLIKQHKLLFLSPIFIMLILLGFLVYSIGPAVITSFIYAGF